MNRVMTMIKGVLILSMLSAGFMANTAVAASMDNMDHKVANVEHRVVIQVSTDDPRTQKIALNNAANLQKAFGMDNVDVQVVAYGPGLSLLTKKGKNAKRVESMAMQNVTFNACGNTMAKIEKKKGHKPALAKGVNVVPGGVPYIAELEEKGYSYIRP